MLNLRKDGDAILLPVKVVPGASRTRYLGVWQGHARIAVAAPPEKGKANRALLEFVAKVCNLRRRDVTVVSGHTAPVKTIRIERATLDAVAAAFKPDRS